VGHALACPRLLVLLSRGPAERILRRMTGRRNFPEMDLQVVAAKAGELN
jgi:hypothetical protein